MTQWYYADHDRNRHGPVSGRDLADLHANGQLAPDTLVWREGLAQWQPWQSLMAEVLAPAAPLAAAEPAMAGGPAIARNDFNPYAVAEPRASYAAAADVRSPYAPPRATIDAGSEYVADGEVVYAGFWKRFAAYAIDTVLLMIVFGILGAVFGFSGAELFSDEDRGAFTVFYLVEIALMVLYFAWMHASVNQATLGKLAIGIKVTDDDGQRISLGRGVGRALASIVSSLTLCIGYIMAGFTDRKRALHDMLGGTLVVDRWAFTSEPDRQRHELGTVTVVIIVLACIGMLVYVAAIALLVGAAASLGR